MLETRLARTWLTLLAVSATAQAIIKSPPLMVKQPPNIVEILYQTDANFKPVILECKAEGEPAPKYQWSKNGRPFNWQTDDRITQQPGKGMLVITMPKVEDSGRYQCSATNEHGTATSVLMFVRNSELDSFPNEDPGTVTVAEGDSVGLFCQPPDGYPKPSVSWVIQDNIGRIQAINSSRMTVDPEGTLWFSNVTRDDASNDFIYACSATSKFRNEFKLGNWMYLKVIQTGSRAVQTKNEPTEQFVSRKNTVIFKSKTLALWCIYGGTPLPEMQWRKKDGRLPFDRVSFENYGKTLVIQNVDYDDAGIYECEASNGVGSAKSYTMTVKVQAIPYFTVEPEIQSKGEGETAEVFCEAKGVPFPHYNWTYNGMRFNIAPLNPRRIVYPNRLVISNLTKADTGNYGCKAFNEHGYVYKDVYVNVLALPPEIRIPPKDVSTVDGKQVNMTCRVFGAPTPRITWTRNGQELTGGLFQTTEEGDLMIMSVSVRDAGNYTCHARNKFGEQEAHGSLVVKDHTRITEKPQNYEIAAGRTATFRCNAVADPDLELDIKWLRGRQKIDFDQEPRFIQHSDFSLIITMTTELDSGLYTCVASTQLDKVSESATLIVQAERSQAPNCTTPRKGETDP